MKLIRIILKQTLVLKTKTITKRSMVCLNKWVKIKLLFKQAKIKEWIKCGIFDAESEGKRQKHFAYRVGIMNQKYLNKKSSETKLKNQNHKNFFVPHKPHTFSTVMKIKSGFKCVQQLSVKVPASSVKLFKQWKIRENF